MKRPPSLLRRAALAVLATFVLVFGVLLAGIGWRELALETGDLDRELLRSTTHLAAALDEVSGEAEAETMLRVQRRIMLGADPSEPPLHMLLMRRRDGWRAATAAAPALDIAILAPGISHLQLGGVALRVYVSDGPQWRVAYVDDRGRRADSVLTGIAADLLLYLLIAQPFLLLPVWIALRSALSPLRRLAADVASRRPDDLTPVQLSRPYSELRPLADALNGQFARAALQLQRERAFVHDAAHELRTPLAVIGTQAHVLAVSDGAERLEARQRLEAAVARASHLTHQLLRLAQADALATAPRGPVDVMALARDTLAGFAPQAAQQGAELSLAGPDTLTLDSDARALRSVLENLVDNALRYGGRGVEVEVAIDADAARWTLAVRDDGPGLDAADRERVFERFWRGRGATAGGAGLGLAIVREAVRALGGEVSVTAGAAGRGCCFCAAMPRAPQTPAAARPPGT